MNWLLKVHLEFMDKYWGGGAIALDKDAARYRVLREKAVQMILPHDPTPEALDELADRLLDEVWQEVQARARIAEGEQQECQCGPLQNCGTCTPLSRR